MNPTVKVLVVGSWVGWGGNRGSIAPPLSLESWNVSPIILAPVFSSSSAQVSFSYTLLAKPSDWIDLPVHILFHHPWAIEDTWRKITQPPCRCCAKLMVSKLSNAGDPSLLLWFAFSPSIHLSPPCSTEHNVLAQMWIYSSWSSPVPALAGTSFSLLYPLCPGSSNLPSLLPFPSQCLNVLSSLFRCFGTWRLFSEPTWQTDNG